MHIKAKDHPYFAKTNKAKGKPINSEFHEQLNIINYCKLQYPDLIVISTLNGEYLPIGQAKQVASLQTDRGLPDMIFLESRGGYSGLIIELKKDGERIVKQDGSWASDHVAEQADLLDRLRKKGYYACFGLGYEDTVRTINWYMKLISL